MKECRLVVCVLALCLVATGSPTAEQLYKEAQKAEKSGQSVRAYLLYAEAAAADPTNLSYWERAQALRPLASLMKTAEPVPEMPANQVDRTMFGPISTRELEQTRIPLPPPELKIQPGARDFDLRGDSKELWEQVAKTLGLMVVFDTQYQPTRPFRFQLDNADYRETLRALEHATASFLTPVSERLIFVASDSIPKRTEFETMAAVVVPFSETISVQELQEIVVGVRGALDIPKMTVDSQRHLILIKDRVFKARLAEKLLQDLLRPRAQLALEVEILVTDKTSSLSYGISTQTAFPLVSFVKSRFLTTSTSAGQFLTFGGGASLLGIGITGAQLFASVAKANSTTLLNTEVVAVDGLPSTLHVGDKYPIVTNGYFGSTSSSGQVFAPPPTFTFEDLGLVLKVTPRLHDADEVTLDLDVEFKLLGAGAVDGIPIISRRKYESKIRVRSGEWAVIAGLMSGSEGRTITGIPGMTSVPFLRSNKINSDHSETLIVLKPHLLILPPTESVTTRSWFGTETRLPGNF